MRNAQIKRKTAETDIKLSLNLDGTGKSNIKSGCGFLDHCLTLFAKHGSFDLDVLCKGDVEVDYHHSVEDIGICLGDAFKEAIGDMRGICRYGNSAKKVGSKLRRYKDRCGAVSCTDDTDGSCVCDTKAH